MNMLRDEKNQEYRLVIKNTLEFDPEILKRYVNFMNNPDERTAVDQFGKDDKYFGICILMVTMPGLPMFGHGQIEGFAEKYGMEFRRAYWEEKADPYLVGRHEHDVFPLLRKRYLFAEVDQFALYDFYSAGGQVNEDVYAYSNRVGEEKALIIYHNRYGEARGWIKKSAASSLKSGNGDNRQLVRRELSQALDLNPGDDHYSIFRDQISGLEYIRSNRDLAENGLYLEMGAYKYHVFMDFRQVQDNEWHQYGQLAAYLDGRGVPSIDETLKEIVLQPVHYPFRELTNVRMINRLLSARTESQVEKDLLSEIGQKSAHLLMEINNLTGAGKDHDEIKEVANHIQREMEMILGLTGLKEKAKAQSGRNFKSAVKVTLSELSLKEKDLGNWFVLFGWALTRDLGRVVGDEGAEERSQSWFDEWLLGRILASSMIDLGLNESNTWDRINLIRILIRHQSWHLDKSPKSKRAYRILKNSLKDEFVRGFLQINRSQGILWFNKEAFEDLLAWMLRIAVVDEMANPEMNEDEIRQRIANHYKVIRKLHKAESNSDYQLEKLLDAAGK
jgi:hypothetical protein